MLTVLVIDLQDSCLSLKEFGVLQTVSLLCHPPCPSHPVKIVKIGAVGDPSFVNGIPVMHLCGNSGNFAILVSSIRDGL